MFLRRFSHSGDGRRYNGRMNDDGRDCSALAPQVSRVTRGRPLREFAQQTSGCVTYGVLFKMSKGRHVSPEQLHKWATAIGEDPDDWYRYGGYPEMARNPPDHPDAAAPAQWRPRTEAPDRFTDVEEALDALIRLVGARPPTDPKDRAKLLHDLRSSADYYAERAHGAFED